MGGVTGVWQSGFDLLLRKPCSMSLCLNYLIFFCRGKTGKYVQELTADFRKVMTIFYNITNFVGYLSGCRIWYQYQTRCRIKKRKRPDNRAGYRYSATLISGSFDIRFISKIPVTKAFFSLWRFYFLINSANLSCLLYDTAGFDFLSLLGAN